jgi:hypothetical protein
LTSACKNFWLFLQLTGIPEHCYDFLNIMESIFALLASAISNLWMPVSFVLFVCRYTVAKAAVVRRAELAFKLYCETITASFCTRLLFSTKIPPHIWHHVTKGA